MRTLAFGIFIAALFIVWSGCANPPQPADGPPEGAGSEPAGQTGFNVSIGTAIEPGKVAAPVSAPSSPNGIESPFRPVLPACKKGVVFTISREDLGDKWPFVVSKGRITYEGETVVFETSGAKYVIIGQDPSPPLDEIWLVKDDVKADLSPLLNEVLERCK